MKLLENKVAIVTGGSRGIGEAISFMGNHRKGQELRARHGGGDQAGLRPEKPLR